MPLEFEWDERKRLANLAKHGIDFVRAKEIWLGDVFETPSPVPVNDEARTIAYGIVADRIVAVVFVWRMGRRRLISARRARANERKTYQDAFGRGT